MSLILSVPAFFGTEYYLRLLKPSQQLDLPFDVASKRFSPDNSAIVVYSQTHSTKDPGILAVYTYPSLQERWRTTALEPHGAHFSADGKTVQMDNYKEVVEWDAQTGARIGSGPSRLRSVVWNLETGAERRRYVVKEQGDGTSKSWYLHDTKTGTSVFLQKVGEQGWRHVLFTSDERYVVAVNAKSGMIRCWETTSGKAVPVPESWRNLSPQGLYPTPDGKLIVLCRDNTVKEIPLALPVKPENRQPANRSAKILTTFPGEIFSGELVDEGRFLRIAGYRLHLENAGQTPLNPKMFYRGAPEVLEEPVTQIIDRKTGIVRTASGWKGGTQYELVGDQGWCLVYNAKPAPLGRTPQSDVSFTWMSWMYSIAPPTPRLLDLRSGEEWFLPSGYEWYSPSFNHDGTLAITQVSGSQRLAFWKLPRRP